VNDFKNIPEPPPIVPHRGTASRSTLSRMRARRPLSVTTSTPVCSTASRSISRPLIEQTAVGFQVHEKINVAPCDRAQDANVSRPALDPQREESCRAWWSGVPAKAWPLHCPSKIAPVARAAAKGDCYQFPPLELDSCTRPDPAQQPVPATDTITTATAAIITSITGRGKSRSCCRCCPDYSVRAPSRSGGDS
jgi:hypothetical protein